MAHAMNNREAESFLREFLQEQQQLNADKEEEIRTLFTTCPHCGKTVEVKE